MTVLEENRRGIHFVLPDLAPPKQVSVVEVGPFLEDLLASELNRFFGVNIQGLTKIKSYVLVHEPMAKSLETLLPGKPFVDPIIHQASFNEALIYRLGIPFDYVLQSMLRPGTSDMEGDTALRQALRALGQAPSFNDKGMLSTQYFLRGNLSRAEVRQVAEFLANPNLFTNLDLTRTEYNAGKKLYVPIVTLSPEVKVETYDLLHMSDEELLKLSEARSLAANLEEMQQFRDQFKDPHFIKYRTQFGLTEQATDVEIEDWFGLRSEHCFHKEFNAKITYNGQEIHDGIFKTFIEDPARQIYGKLQKRGKNWIASMFEDNSGVVYYNEDFMFCIKFETHNSPSNKEPVQGSKTGIDGVNRDVYGTLLGTFEAIANFFFFCTGDPHYQGWLPKGVKHPYVILKGVTQGTREGGNESQIPTLWGGVITDPRYTAKCLDYCGTVGWSPVQGKNGVSFLDKNPKVGDLVFVVGQAVGIDGIHGATQSSLSASEKITLGHVQADFSFIQAKMKQYILEIARDGLTSAVTDFGAMGLLSASNEMAKSTGGLSLDLAKHPVKFEGIQPWQIGCSETQDRMLLIIRPDHREQIVAHAKLHDVELAELGTLTDSGYIHLVHGNKTVGLLDIKKLFDKEPRKKMVAAWHQPAYSEPTIQQKYTLQASLNLIMSRPDCASKEWFLRQMDASVGGMTILGPLLDLKKEFEAQATLQKPLDTQGKDFGALAYAKGIRPKIADLDPYHAAQVSFLDMVGKIIAVGGKLPHMEIAQWDGWAVCGNYCQPNSDQNEVLDGAIGRKNLGALVREGMGIEEIVLKLNIPVISGKDSMKNSCEYEVEPFFNLEHVPPDLKDHIHFGERKGKERLEIHDPPTYLSSCAAKIEDYRTCVTPEFKQEGDLIYVLGTTKRHLGASQFYEAVGYNEEGKPKKGGHAPQADLDEFIKIAEVHHQAIAQELLASSSYIEVGGLLTHLATYAMAGELGASLTTRCILSDGSCKTDEDYLYSETPGRLLVTVDPQHRETFEKLVAGMPCKHVGMVSKSGLQVNKLDLSIENIDLDLIKRSYQKTLGFGVYEEALHG